MAKETETFKRDKLIVKVYQDSNEMSAEAATIVAGELKSAIFRDGEANLVLATGAGQFSFLENLQKMEIDWKKITVFHLDEYIGIPETHPASFRKYLKDRILDQVEPKKVYFMEGDADDLETEISRYEYLLKKHQIDVACIGIGENGHIAFNDPPVASFNDSRLVKIVELDEACRRQQFGEGWFQSIEDVPARAITMTIPAIMNCNFISCVVPDERKAQAVHDTLNNEISTACPATILRRHPSAVLFLDKNSASLS